MQIESGEGEGGREKKKEKRKEGKKKKSFHLGMFKKASIGVRLQRRFQG